MVHRVVVVVMAYEMVYENCTVQYVVVYRMEKGLVWKKTKKNYPPLS